eukprot:m.232535 g.232535  ORF g.232535 m.232535 type:complete len:1377 (-) comp15716_c1_seq5:2029-6159(-)
MASKSKRLGASEVYREGSNPYIPYDRSSPMSLQDAAAFTYSGMEPDQVMAPTELSFAADAIAVLKELDPEVGLSREALLTMDDILHFSVQCIAQRAAMEAERGETSSEAAKKKKVPKTATTPQDVLEPVHTEHILAAYEAKAMADPCSPFGKKGSTPSLTSLHIVKAVRSFCVGEVIPYADAGGATAVTDWWHAGRCEPPRSHRQRAKLLVSVGTTAALASRIAQLPIMDCAAVYLTGALEYLAFEVLELARNNAKDTKNELIYNRQINKALLDDDELSQMYSVGTVFKGGIIHNMWPRRFGNGGETSALLEAELRAHCGGNDIATPLVVDWARAECCYSRADAPFDVLYSHVFSVPSQIQSEIPKSIIDETEKRGFGRVLADQIAEYAPKDEPTPPSSPKKTRAGSEATSVDCVSWPQVRAMAARAGAMALAHEVREEVERTITESLEDTIRSTLRVAQARTGDGPAAVDIDLTDVVAGLHHPLFGTGRMGIVMRQSTSESENAVLWERFESEDRAGRPNAFEAAHLGEVRTDKTDAESDSGEEEDYVSWKEERSPKFHEQYKDVMRYLRAAQKQTKPILPFWAFSRLIEKCTLDISRDLKSTITFTPSAIRGLNEVAEVHAVAILRGANWLASCDGRKIVHLRDVVLARALHGATPMGVYASGKGGVEVMVTTGADPEPRVQSLSVHCNSNALALSRVPDRENVVSIVFPPDVISRALEFSSLDLSAEPAAILTTGSSWFRGCERLVSVEFSDGFYEIGEGSFRDCVNLQSIVLPPSLRRIQNNTFSGCTRLRSIALPSGLTHIGQSAFEKCRSLTTIDFPISLEQIGDYSFRGCEGLESVIIPGGVTTLNSDTFKQCVNLRSAVLSGVQTIQYQVFAGCVSLHSVVFLSSIQTLRRNAFANCRRLSDVQFEFSGWTPSADVFVNNDWLIVAKVDGTRAKVTSALSMFVGCSRLQYVVTSDSVVAFDNGKPILPPDDTPATRCRAELLRYWTRQTHRLCAPERRAWVVYVMMASRRLQSAGHYVPEEVMILILEFMLRTDLGWIPSAATTSQPAVTPEVGSKDQGPDTPAMATSEEWKVGWKALWDTPAEKRRKPKVVRHAARILSLATGVGGKVYSSSIDCWGNENAINVWDEHDGALLQTLKGHTDWVEELAVGCDGTLFSGSHDCTVRVWSGETNTHLRTLHGHSAPLRSLASNETHLFSGSDDASVRVWLWNTGEHVHTLTGFRSSVLSLALGSNHQLFCGLANGVIGVHSASDFSLIRSVNKQSEGVSSLCVKRDGTVISCSEYIRTWSSGDWEILQTSKTKTFSVVLAPDDTVLATNVGRQLNTYFDGLDERPKTALVGQKNPVNAMAVTPTGVVWIGHCDGSISIIN